MKQIHIPLPLNLGFSLRCRIHLVLDLVRSACTTATTGIRPTLAVDLGVPITVHAQEAEEDTERIMKEIVPEDRVCLPRLSTL